MEEQFKEIEGLLETTTENVPESPQQKIKKYIKLIFPHVALVAVVCLYAVIGAYIFYRLESPNEDRLKSIGKNNIAEMRLRMLELVKRGNMQSERVWKDSVEEELYRFNDNIYKAFKEQYVRYPDVRIANMRIESTEHVDDVDRIKRHRNPKSRADKGEKMWTASSALFFAATTMATIGYGNIVPATSSGRIACVVFALFGAPLAIITIGDLGKFLSECTIWLYKQMKKGRLVLRTRWRRFRGLTKGNLEDCEENSEDSSHASLDWEDLVMDKTEVPVLMVFTILLLYIAFGGVLFSFLEGWTYMDAFYYSFISLTTIGFGDIVPENHDYIVIMLMYLGIGLAVTTMCIDLVGIQYIQKIHYFGRKFRGTDLLHLLKRKRMIERRLAMGQGEEILQMYMQQIQQQIPEPDPEPDPEPLIVEETYEEKCPSPDWQIDDALITSRYSFTYPNSEKVPSPNVLSIRSVRTPSIYSNSSASARSLMNRYRSRGGSWDESGPSLSEHCSLSTEPSVHLRQAYWDNFKSPEPSLSSFEYDFPLPSPDYAGIATAARNSRRLQSCPNSSFNYPPPSPIGLACMEDWDSYIRMLEEYEKPYEKSPTPTIRTPPLLYGLSPAISPVESLSPVSLHDFQLPVGHQLSMTSISMDVDQICQPHLPPTPQAAEVTSSTRSERLTDVFTPLVDVVPHHRLSPPSPLSPPLPPPVLFTLEVEKELMIEEHEEDQESNDNYISPMVESSSDEEGPSGFDLDLGAFELVDSGMTPETLLNTEEPVIFHQDMPVHSVHHDTVQTEAALANLMSAPSSMLTGAIPPIMVEDNYCFVVDGERVRMGDILGDDQWWRHTSRPTKYFYSEDLRQFHRVNCITAKGKVITAKLATGSVQNQVHHQPTPSSSSTPRSSVSGSSSRPTQSNKVPLVHVYKVIRFYSFWKTCTSFHRIVTMIDRVSADDRTCNPDFKKRLFVQYLWRNAKAVEKARVQKEFDPRRQRLLRFVTDPAQRKRFQKM